MSVRINQPFDEFTDTAGKPLESGYIYVGTYGLNPETNPITIYSDVNLSVPLAQPLRTTGGIPTYLNSPTAIYTTGSYSITVKDSAGRLVFNRPNVDSTGAATIFGWKNYVTNSGFEGGSTGGWNLGKDSGTTIPTSGGLGGGNSGFSPLTLDTTTPLAGSVSLVVTKPTGNIQGSTVYSDPLTFDLEDTVSQGQLTFSYRTPSVSTYTNADLSVFLWDITGGALVTLSLTSLDISTNLPKKFFATFTPTTSTKYRVIFQWTSSSNTNAVSITLDSILLGPNITAPDAASVLSYGIGGTNNVRNVDFNTLMTGGKYINYGANAPGGYTTLKFSLEVIGRDTDFIVQTATCLEPSYRDITWRRTKNSTWGTWYKTSTTSSTVSALDADTLASTTPGTRGLTALSQTTTLDADTVGGLAGVPVGSITIFAGPTTTPTGWLTCDGSAVSRTTYASLFGQVVTSMGTFTVTIAAPGVFTLSAHGMVSGDVIYLTTTGALPTGLSANTLYWVTVINSSTFNVSTTFANYSAGTKVTTSGTQSGTHTARRCPWGLGDGSSTFTLPDLREAAPVGIGTRGVGVSADTYNLGQFKDDQFQGHWHQSRITLGNTANALGSNTARTNENVTFVDVSTINILTDGTNGTPRTGTTTRGKRLGVNFIIKY